jgi:Flp pilus assembly pilin Flp
MKALFNRFLSNEEGTTSIEYGIIAACMVVFLIEAFSLVGSWLAVFFTIAARLTGSAS